MKIEIDPESLEYIQGVLKQHLPSNCQVFAYGSRVKGTSKKFSDLDLVFKSATPVSFSLIAKIHTKFEQSNLPFRVSLIDYYKTDPIFIEAIKNDFVLF